MTVRGHIPAVAAMGLLALLPVAAGGDPFERATVVAQHGPDPFGLQTYPAPQGVLWERWRRLQGEIRDAADDLAACRTEPGVCAPAAARFLALVEKAGSQPVRERIATVNREVNTAVRWDATIARHGMPERWMPPFTSFATGRGDCMDIAIAKYVALLQAGLPPGALRLVLVWDRSVRDHHAVVAADDGGRWRILDSRTMLLREDTDLRDVVPMFSIDSSGVRQFQPVRPFKLKDLLPSA